MAGYKIYDVYTPMPIHGLDLAMGLRETSIHTAGFLYGLAGTITALATCSNEAANSLSAAKRGRGHAERWRKL